MAIALAARRELPGRAARAADRVRVRGLAAGGDRAEPRLAVHAAAGRDRGDRDPARTGCGWRPSPCCRSPAPRCPFTACWRVYDRRDRRRAQPRCLARRAGGAADLRGRVRSRHAARVGRVAGPGAATDARLRAGRSGRSSPRWRSRPSPSVRWQPPTGIPSGSSSGSGTASASRRRTSSGSHFTDVGSGRYDFWRVSLDAFVGPSDRRSRTGQLRRLLRARTGTPARSRRGRTASS